MTGERVAVRIDAMTDRDLVARCHAGDPTGTARGELVARYQPLVRSLASKLDLRGGNTRQDIVSVGQVGLLKAIRDFDLDRGTPFPAYAVAKVRGEMFRWFRDSRYAVHVPRPLHELSMQVRRAAGDLTMQFGRDPTVDEIADELGVDSSQIVEALAVSSAERARSAQLVAGLADAALAERSDLPEVDLLAAISALPAKTRRVLHDRYWLGLSQRDVAQRFGMSQAHVSRIERAILASLRSRLGPAHVARSSLD